MPVTTRIDPTSKFDHRLASVDAIVTRVGVGLQIAFATIEILLFLISLVGFLEQLYVEFEQIIALYLSLPIFLQVEMELFFALSML